MPAGLPTNRCSLKWPDHKFSTLTSAVGAVARTYRRVVHSCLRCWESYCAASKTAPPPAVQTSVSLHAPAQESVVQSNDACHATTSLIVHPFVKALHHNSSFSGVRLPRSLWMYTTPAEPRRQPGPSSDTSVPAHAGATGQCRYTKQTSEVSSASIARKSTTPQCSSATILPLTLL